jgi:hypothetical protein
MALRAIAPQERCRLDSHEDRGNQNMGAPRTPLSQSVPS